MGVCGVFSWTLSLGVAMCSFLFLFDSHLNKTTTYEDPRKDWGEEPPQPREVELSRHPELGFGFVAGSEKPVIVR